MKRRPTKPYTEYLAEAKALAPARPAWEVAWAERFIDEFDWTNIKDRLMKPVKDGGSGFTKETIDRTWPCYRAYLLQIFMWPGEEVVPDAETDEWWHTTILFSKKYTTLCNRLYGRYIHHVPTVETLDKKK